MKKNLNMVILSGNLTKDPEKRTMPSGDVVAVLRLATSDVIVDRNTQAPKQVTTYTTVKVMTKQAQACLDYLRKGSPVELTGRLKLEEWTGQDQVKRSEQVVIAGDVIFVSGQGSQVEGEAPAAEHDAGPPPAQQVPAQVPAKAPAGSPGGQQHAHPGAPVAAGAGRPNPPFAQA